MTDLDERLRDAFAARADSTKIDHRRDLEASLTEHTTVVSRSWSPIVAIAAVLVAIMIAGLALVTRPSARDEVPASVPPTPPRSVATTPSDLGSNPLLPEVFPTLPADDQRQSHATASYSGFVSFESTDSGRAVIGRIESGALVDPMLVGVYSDADEIPFTTAGDEISINDLVYERHLVDNNPTQWSLVLRGDTDVVITGADPEAFVAAVDGSPVTKITRPSNGGVTFSLSPLPLGYETIVEPSTFPIISPRVALTLGSETDEQFGVVTTGRLSDLLLQATGTPFHQVDVNGTSAWASEPPAGSVATVNWQVAPDTWATAMAATPGDALELARSMRFVDEVTWQATYDVTRPESFALQTGTG